MPKINTEIETGHVTEQPKYPCLKVYKPGDRSREMVVMFLRENEGTVVHTKSTAPSDQLGRHSTTWSEYNFVPFYGTIRLVGV